MVGFAYATVSGSLRRQPVIWAADQTAATPLAMPTGMNVGQALGISDSGLIVGYGAEASGQFGSTNVQTLVWSDPATVYVLADLVTNAPGWQFTGTVAGLSLNSTLVTEAVDPQGQRRFVMLQLVPEPGTCLALVAGLGLALGTRPRHVGGR